MSPTARTLACLRRLGYLADVVERWLPHANVRKDLFGCIDILAVHRREPGCLAVQATSLPNLSSRLKKARSRPELAVWLQAGLAFECWGWHQGASGRWQVKRVAVLPGDLQPVVLVQLRRQKPDRQPLLFVETPATALASCQDAPGRERSA